MAKTCTKTKHSHEHKHFVQKALGPIETLNLVMDRPLFMVDTMSGGSGQKLSLELECRGPGYKHKVKASSSDVAALLANALPHMSTVSLYGKDGNFETYAASAIAPGTGTPDSGAAAVTFTHKRKMVISRVVNLASGVVTSILADVYFNFNPGTTTEFFSTGAEEFCGATGTYGAASGGAIDGFEMSWVPVAGGVAGIERSVYKTQWTGSGDTSFCEGSPIAVEPNTISGAAHYYYLIPMGKPFTQAGQYFLEGELSCKPAVSFACAVANSGAVQVEIFAGIGHTEIEDVVSVTV